jgi:hypothetical protein
MSRTDTSPNDGTGSRRKHAPHDPIDTAFTWLFAGSFEAALIAASTVIAVHASIPTGIAVFIGFNAFIVAMHHVITTSTTLEHVA